MIHLSQVCLLVFLAALGVFIYQLQIDADYSLSFLFAGATGCLWLLMHAERRYTQLTNYREHPTPARPKRIAPKCVVSIQIPARKQMPTLPEHQNFSTHKTTSIK